MDADRQVTLISRSPSSSFLEASCALALQLLALSLPGVSLSISMPAAYQLSQRLGEDVVEWPSSCHPLANLYTHHASVQPYGCC
jgi:hypothetical protein